MKRIVGIIGFGNMGSCIAQRLIQQSDRYQVWTWDKDVAKLKNIEPICVASDNIDLTNRSEVIILAVKPQEAQGVLLQIRDYAKEKLLISIAAGLSLEYIEKIMGRIRLIRAMPNIAAKVGKAVTCICKGKFASDGDFYVAQRIFFALGKTLQLQEEMINAATAISGSGPAYFYDFIESKGIDYHNIDRKITDEFSLELEKAARSIGFNIAQASFLAQETVEGSIALLKHTGLTPAELIKQIASKGGTTEAALKVLHQQGTLVDAVRAALRRAEELSQSKV